MFIESANFNSTGRINGTLRSDVEHRHTNYEICNAIDTIRLDVTLDEMVKNGRINKELAKIYSIQAGALRAAILSENNRAHGL